MIVIASGWNILLTKMGYCSKGVDIETNTASLLCHVTSGASWRFVAIMAKSPLLSNPYVSFYRHTMPPHYGKIADKDNWSSHFQGTENALIPLHMYTV